jgi:hypothetical protein
MHSYLHYGNGLVRLEPDAAMESKALQVAVAAKSAGVGRSCGMPDAASETRLSAS